MADDVKKEEGGLELLGRLDVLNAEDFDTDIVPVPEWGGSVRVRSMTAEEADNVGFDLLNAQGDVDARKAKGMSVKLVQWCTIDENGRQLFKEKDVQLLARKSRKAIERVSDRIRELSDMMGGPQLVVVKCEHCDKPLTFDVRELAKLHKEQAEAGEVTVPKNA